MRKEQEHGVQYKNKGRHVKGGGPPCKVLTLCVVYDNRKCASWHTGSGGWMCIFSTYEYILTLYRHSAKLV